MNVEIGIVIGISGFDDRLPVIQQQISIDKIVIAAARSGLVMNQFCMRCENDALAKVADLQAQVNILVGSKVMLIESVYLVEDGAPGHETSGSYG